MSGISDLLSGVAWAFGVSVENLTFNEVTKIEGLKLEADVYELKTIASNTAGLGTGIYSRKKIPGRMKSGVITLTRAMPTSPSLLGTTASTGDFIGWIQTVFTGNMSVARKSMTISIYSVGTSPFSSMIGLDNTSTGIIAQFVAVNCWPTAVEYGTLEAGANSAILEKVTIHHEGVFEQIAYKNSPFSGNLSGLTDGGILQF